MRTLSIMLVAAAGFSFTPRASAETHLINAIQAVVHDSVVTFAELQDRMTPARELLVRQYRGQPELLEQKVTAALNENLEQLIERQLILQDFRSKFAQKERLEHANKIIGKDIDKDIEREIHTRYGGDRVAFMRTLQAEGVTLERYRQQIRNRIIISWLRQENISSSIIISPHKVEEHYLARREEFKVQEEVKLRMIVLKCPGQTEAASTAALAEDILTKLKEGATFAEMASIHSEGSQKTEGGDLGWWELSRLSRGLADTAAALQVGQNSSVLSRSAGDDYWVCQYSNKAPVLARHYVVDLALKKEDLVEERRLESAAAAANLPPPVEFYLMQVEDKRPERFKTLAEVREQIEQDLLVKEQTRLANLWLDRLKKKTFVQVF
ncbi:MAG: peptidylprolyl isomerase [Verrucomicrobia bacterium]|jgi:parvulin-like peptidyl-prolyl isomerase|nr:peptidylprolyl isomerase [Verrucomicrobiota bacterium]OQC23947.1 MAG: Chaperone SurA precursor [Verrucomicrobia bacterium ADurb.Bin063]MBP8015883.1 peptidylprolyl isomerase [Verrucomicrobiota bacterium]HNW08376.1 peptidylprolyl isomerase [Verrucomicrobiota bacterium]HNZ76683.1 peptidylprolyl isomerase [Verrucomicrobiota bacterium]